MNYALWANATAAAHFASLVLVVGGLLVCFRYKRFRPWESGILLAIVLLWSYYGNCPLTILEQHFRDLAGQDSNLTSVGFLPYYANKLMSFNLSSRTVQRFTFFTGGTLFTASIGWLSPVMHVELFKIRRMFKRYSRKFV